MIILPNQHIRLPNDLQLWTETERSAYQPARVGLQDWHNTMVMIGTVAARTGACLIAAAAVATGRLDQADAQAVLDAAEATIAAQVRAAYDKRAGGKA